MLDVSTVRTHDWTEHRLIIRCEAGTGEVEIEHVFGSLRTVIKTQSE